MVGVRVEDQGSLWRDGRGEGGGMGGWRWQRPKGVKGLT